MLKQQDACNKTYGQCLSNEVFKDLTVNEFQLVTFIKIKDKRNNNCSKTVTSNKGRQRCNFVLDFL